jgi:hypothetical protein
MPTAIGKPYRLLFAANHTAIAVAAVQGKWGHDTDGLSLVYPGYRCW